MRTISFMAASVPFVFSIPFERSCSIVWIVNQVGPSIEDWNRARKPPVRVRSIHRDGVVVPSHSYASGQRWALELEMTHSTVEDTHAVSAALLTLLQDGA